MRVCNGREAGLNKRSAGWGEKKPAMGGWEAGRASSQIMWLLPPCCLVIKWRPAVGKTFK